ncbi:MAG: protein kinase, partial [Gemmatimonadetes bacterium]|nr:protein kinase [Gemmatimonadota bacterium]
MSTHRAPRSSEVPKVLGGLEDEYEILSELGRGGTAVVYLARDRALDREVAVKVIRSTYVEDEEAVARLVREARTVGQLQHPNIVMLYGTRRLDDNSLALIMQYVPGRPLKSVIRNDGPLPFKMVAAVLDDIGSALLYAHRQKIVHRDIKPENIYLDEAVEVARLADFGIARHWDKDAGITLPGMAIGTPTYMSPEQIDGAHLDGRSDIYSLGIVGYEMLTGQQPWAGENLYSIIYKQKREQLPPLDEVRPGLPAALQQAVEGALHKIPDDRWQTAEQFLACLRSQTVEDVRSRHGVERPSEADPGSRAPAPVEPAGDEPEPVPAGPLVDDDALTIKYVRPQENELEHAVTGQPDPADGQDQGPRRRFELEDEDQEAPAPAPWGETPEERPAARGRVMALALLAFVSAGLGFVAFNAMGEDGGLVDPVPGNGAAVTPTQGGPSGSETPAGGLPAGGTAPDPASRPESGLPDRLVPLVGTLTGAPGQATAQPVRVQVLDADGMPATVAVVEFRVESGGGAVSPQIADVDSEGIAEATWVLGNGVQPDRVTARVPGRSGVDAVTFVAETGGTAVVDAGSPGGSLPAAGGGNGGNVPAALNVVAGAAQQGTPGEPLPQPVRIQVLNQDGAPATGVTVLFTPDEGHGNASMEATTVDDQGFAETSWTLGPTSGSQRLRIQVAGQSVFTVAEATAAAAASPRLSARATVVSGATHACAVTSTGVLSCWGGNTYGQLGDGGRTRQSRPTGVAGGLTFARVSAGFTATCGITTAGDLYCWGRNEVGELGDGTTLARATPNRVAGGRTFVDVDVGFAHACARTAAGQAYCWGKNDSGQLGDGGSGDQTRPSPVGGGILFRSITAGWNHTCGTSGSQTFCWGANDRGQLGDGSGANAALPALVAVEFGLSQVTAGGSHTCGVSAGGGAYCWGNNQYGQLGDGTTQDRDTPVPVDSEAGFTAVEAGPVHTCALTPSGAAYCWGRNNWG